MNPLDPAPGKEVERLGESTPTISHFSFFQRITSALPWRTRWLLGSMIILGLLALIAGRPLQRQYLTYLLLRSDAPSPEVLSSLIEQMSNRQSLLLRLWHTQRIPHRRFVVNYLGGIMNIQSNLFQSMVPVLVEAASDADLPTRELAMAALAKLKHPQARPLVWEQLNDPDPASRLLGLQSLRRMADSNEVAMAVGFLSDQDPRVVVAAGLVLQHATGQDFGFKSHLALPRFTSSDRTNPPPPPDLPAISQSLQRWRNWWNVHQVEHSILAPRPSAPSHTAFLPAPDFNLEDSDGKLVRLSDYRGKPVLLAFWSLDAPIALEDAPALNALNRHHVAVLGICLPPLPSCADEHQHDHDSEHAHHQHHETPSPSSSPAQTRVLVQATIQEKQINYPILIDEDGKVGLRCGVEDLPTYVLIDAHGMICRLFPGNRTQPVLEAIVNQAVGGQMTGKVFK